MPPTGRRLPRVARAQRLPWNRVSGAIPPWSRAAWDSVFGTPRPHDGALTAWHTAEAKQVAQQMALSSEDDGQVLLMRYWMRASARRLVCHFVCHMGANTPCRVDVLDATSSVERPSSVGCIQRTRCGEPSGGCPRSGHRDGTFGQARTPSLSSPLLRARWCRLT
jgi:hypothetical protein